MNRVYSILVKGEDKQAAEYQRKVDHTVGYSKIPDLGNELVQGSEASYYNYQAEQLVQICRKSLLKGALERIDPLNTYAHPFAIIDPVTEIGSLPADVYMDILEPDMRHQWSSKVLAVTVDASAGVAFINGVPAYFTVEDNMTGIIPVMEGLGIRFRGSLPASAFSTSLSLQRQPYRDIKPLYDTLRITPVRWLQQYEDFKNTTDINDWIAAFILNYCEVVDA
jgi:hypothetical protein